MANKQISSKDFLKTFVEGQQAGHSALQIALTLGMPDKKESAQIVSVRASQLRKKLGKDLVPMLKRSGRQTSEDLTAYVQGLWAELKKPSVADESVVD